jgi:formylglycine-generating enzyme required for sulfatase activity
MTKWPIVNSIPIYNRKLFTIDLTPVQLGQFNKLNNVVQEVQVANETRRSRLGRYLQLQQQTESPLTGSAINITNTELSSLSGITGNIQTQLDTHTTDSTDLETELGSH